MRILGIDEAGRGPVLGPLVVAGVLISGQDEPRLKSLGVRDSKALSRERRAELALQIAGLAQCRSVSIPPEQLQKNLNLVELEASAELIAQLRPDLVYLDVPTHPRGVADYCRKLQRLIGRHIALTGENHADQRYPVVSAASIIAKVERDRAILALRRAYGDFGWGYPSERRTREFLRSWYLEHGRLPPCARANWKTVRDLLQVGWRR
ncbi:MAG: ribonuclease HII [Candidatus Acetothermia bacterium]|jgi:ribonuclease HII|nr:ribonuclease HII [Candidatus Acetothermia bacterium]MDH7505780.1 ribonuclease HII [Candidatus Acetothermia bacterium]